MFRQTTDRANRPRTGLLYDINKRDKYSNKLQIRSEKSLSELTITNDLHDALCNKDVNGFWETLNSKLNVKRDKPKVVAGLADPAEIADGFATYFATTCKPNSAAKHDQLRNEYIKNVLIIVVIIHINTIFSLSNY